VNSATDWRKYWDDKSEKATSDFALDHGNTPSGTPRGKEIEALSDQELIAFIDPQPGEVIFDAGCGTGANMFLLHQKVKRTIGMDFCQGVVDRCQRRIENSKMTNAECFQGSVTSVPLPDRSVDKIICLSVFQYLNEAETQQAFSEFARVLRDSGTLVLHVKNLSSLYLSTLAMAKKLKKMLGKKVKMNYYHSFRWYVQTLASYGLDVVDYNSFSIIELDAMPRSWMTAMQEWELRNYRGRIMRLGWIRRRGAELKLKARLTRRVRA
jgi:ubiquinone/menaquinone biosynthesis C-methylase UbiE